MLITTIFCRLKGINRAAGVGRPRAISQVREIWEKHL